jgi:NAD(P)-dependent dehydrogenase (short-subunit alcohol dehydrogenase family)
MKRYEKWLKKHAASLVGKHAVITGANSGIGFAAASHFLSLGARLTLACRSAARANDAKKLLLATYPDATITVAVLDLASHASIGAFAAEMAKRGEKIDILLHCAGVYYPREQTTADGLPTTVGVNFVGTAMLTEALLPLMGENGRVIFTTSLVDRFGKTKKRENGARNEGYYEYSQSKLLLSLYALRAARNRAAGSPAFIAVHPGITATSLLDPAKTSHHPLFSRIGHAFLFVFTHKKEKAALTAVYAAAGDAENGDCIGPRGIFGTSGYPHKTRYCRRVQRLAKSNQPLV